VRNIATVLLMVGRGLEKPGIVQQLLDIQQTPCKPQYSMADEEPLLFYKWVLTPSLLWDCMSANEALNRAFCCSVRQLACWGTVSTLLVVLHMSGELRLTAGISKAEGLWWDSRA
jgi:hypothetical protein